jgi:hypothetical protein
MANEGLPGDAFIRKLSRESGVPAPTVETKAKPTSIKDQMALMEAEAQKLKKRILITPAKGPTDRV